jgi:hypothetical protein
MAVRPLGRRSRQPVRAREADRRTHTGLVIRLASLEGLRDEC